METSSTLIGLAVLLIFMGPIIFVIIKSSTTEKRLKKNLQSMSSQNGISINTSEVIGNTLIGLDEDVHKLVFSYKNKLKDTFRMVDLNNTKECNITTFKESKHHLKRIALQLKGAETDEIIFYEEDDESSPATDAEVCLSRATYWEKMIRKQLQ